MSESVDPTIFKAKPPTKEDEFFAKEDEERIAALQAERRRKEEELKEQELKQLHYMHCPKCGHKMEEQTERGVLVDVCPNCRGIFLDAGELSALLDKTQSGGSGFFGWLKK